MKYFLKKLTTLIITLFIVSFLAFLAFQVIPADPVTKMLGTEATPERVAALREQLGFNRPVLVRYFDWLKDFLFGGMGTSYSYHMSVKDMIWAKIPITLFLTLFSAVIIIAVSIPLGIWQARWQGSIFDRTFLILNQVIMSIPAFFLGIIFTYIFGILLKLFTPGNFVSYDVNFKEFARYLIFPSIAIALPKIAMTVKMLRTSIIKELKEDYVRTAISRGHSRSSVLYAHVLRNAMIPVVTFLALSIADIIAGSIIIEQVFTIPGLGRLLLTSISNRDFPVVQAIVVLIAFTVILINFAVDIMYQFIDPRIRIS